MSRTDATFIGEVASVTGGLVTVKLRDDMPSTLILIEGESHRVGQIGAFLRIPLGYTQLYAVCTQVGAAAAPQQQSEFQHSSQRWLSIALFGESMGKHFERGVGQYPTVGDEVHLVCRQDLAIIYESAGQAGTITVGHVAASSSIPGRLDLGRLVARHSAIVGSTGAGKSNLVGVLLQAIATQGFPSARVLVIDPHGEYASAVGQNGQVFRIDPDTKKGERPLHVPFWALPFDELKDICLGGLQPAKEAVIRDEVLKRKKASASKLVNPPPEQAITADSPLPFSLKKLWFDLDDFERQTFSDSNKLMLSSLLEVGNPEEVRSNQYPEASTKNTPPYKNPGRRELDRALELMRSRITDARYRFLFEPGAEYAPDLDGNVKADLDTLISSWVGHDRPITVLDVSGLPSEILSTIVGTMLRVIYDTLYWGMELPIGGRRQPLLLVLEEAHLFLPEGSETAAHRTVTKIAKEGRKYGVGLMIVSQRPSELDGTVLSQCGTMISLRLTNGNDRGKVQAAMPDDLGALAALLPSLRTGEGLVMGEAMPIPTRIRFFRALNKPHGDDPKMPDGWQRVPRPSTSHYQTAIFNWRSQSISTANNEVDKDKNA